MFDLKLEISLFILSMWSTIICYFDCSHVTHVNYYYKLFRFQSRQWWIYRIQNGNTEGIRGQGHLKGHDYINRQCNTGVYYVSEKEERKQKDEYKYRTLRIQKNTYECERNVCEYGRQGKCVGLFWYTYARIRIINMQIET